MWSELLMSLPSVVTAGAAVCGLFIAKAGLEKWRSETIGKRKAELAEEVLADFYQARDVIQGARSPGGFSSEGATRPKVEGETKDETQTRNAYFAVAERLRNKAEFFAQLQARRYRFQAHFGKEATKPYDDVGRVQSEIVGAVRMLIWTTGQRYSGEAQLKNQERWEATIWWTTPEEDPIARRLDEIAAAIEKICRPAIQDVIR